MRTLAASLASRAAAALATPEDERRKRWAALGTLGLATLELPTRPVSEFTIERYGCALQAVAGGNLREAADLTLAAMTQSGFVSGILDTITAGTLGLPRTFVGSTPEVRRALEGDDDHDSEYDILHPRAEAKRVMAWGIMLGVGLGQFVDPRDRNRLRPPDSTPTLWGTDPFDGPPQWRHPGANDTPRLEAWNPRWLRKEIHTDRWLLTTYEGEIEIQPGDGWMIFTPYGQRFPWEYGAWKAVVLAAILMWEGMFDRARHSEMLAPVRVGKCPEGTSEPQRELYAQQIEEMRRFAWWVLPPGLTYEVVEATGTVEKFYSGMIADGQTDVMVSLTGNKVLVEGSTGFNSGDFQQRVSSAKRAFYAGAWADCAREQGITPWRLDNYPTTTSSPKVVYNTDPPEDQDAEVKRYGELGRSLVELATGFDRHGFDVDSETIQAIAQRNKIKLRAKPAGPARADEVFAYDLEAGIIQRNEQRARKGLPPLADGNETVPEYRLRIGAEKTPEPAEAGTP